MLCKSFFLVYFCVKYRLSLWESPLLRWLGFLAHCLNIPFTIQQHLRFLRIEVRSSVQSPRFKDSVLKTLV